MKNLRIKILSILKSWFAPRAYDAVNAPILFFDGTCGLCNGFVNFLFKIDKNHIYKVAALQGETARKHLPKAKIEDLNSLVVYRNDLLLDKAQAVIQILDDMGGIWRVLSFFEVLPDSFLNKIYDMVAKSRYRFFGKSDACRLPTAEERSYFLD